MRRRLALLLAPLPLLALAGCGSSSPAAAPSSAAPSTPASSSSGASPGDSPSGSTFNPCDNIDVKAVSKVLGTKLTVNTGTASTPRCALLPATKGGPTFEMSYLWFDGGLDAAWKTMQVPTGTITEPTIKGADATRQVEQRSDSALAVSAFLQNGDLIQSLNGLALAPYDEKRLLKATRVVLTQLSAKAPAS